MRQKNGDYRPDGTIVRRTLWNARHEVFGAYHADEWLASDAAVEAPVQIPVASETGSLFDQPE